MELDFPKQEKRNGKRKVFSLFGQYHVNWTQESKCILRWVNIKVILNPYIYPMDFSMKPKDKY